MIGKFGKCYNGIIYIIDKYSFIYFQCQRETIFFCKITDYSEIFMTDLAGSDFSAVTEQAMGTVQ